MRLSLFIFIAFIFSVGLVSSAFATDSSQENWYFKVFLDGKEVGYHSFEITTKDSRQTLTSIASFDVKFLFVNAFRYRHQNIEVWQGDCLVSINSTTENGSEDFAVSGKLEERQFFVNTLQQEIELPECVGSYAYWKPEVLKSPKLLNGQTGVYGDVSFSEVQSETFKITEDSKVIDARRYSLTTGAGDIKIWYASKDNAWVGLEAKVSGGRTLRYELSDAL